MHHEETAGGKGEAKDGCKLFYKSICYRSAFILHEVYQMRREAKDLLTEIRDALKEQ
jgi:hypothetical protein